MLFRSVNSNRGIPRLLLTDFFGVETFLLMCCYIASPCPLMMPVIEMFSTSRRGTMPPRRFLKTLFTSSAACHFFVLSFTSVHSPDLTVLVFSFSRWHSSIFMRSISTIRQEKLIFIFISTLHFHVICFSHLQEPNQERTSQLSFQESVP